MTTRRLILAVIITWLFALITSAQAPPIARPQDGIAWEYENVDAIAGPVAEFLVCLDGQPTAACARVPASASSSTPAPGVKAYRWTFPPLLAGPHRVTVQACTAAAALCSSGEALAFVFQPVIANPKNLKLAITSGGA